MLYITNERSLSMTIWAICFPLFAIFFSSFASASITCGGFLQSIVNINYSRVSIKLLTATGNLKYTSDCAPNNGYYFIPVYDHGDYILKIDAPKGWKFDPYEVKLSIDGSSDFCSKGHDINFNFKGFSVFGKVVSYGLETGPQGLKVSLKEKSTNIILKDTLTDSLGMYTFEEVFPGSYEVVADATENKFLESNSISFTVVSDNVELLSKETKQLLVISGYPLEGRVISDGEPIRDVYFALISTSGVRRVPEMCNKSPISHKKVEKAIKDGSYLCYILSDDKGYFKFENLVPGDYQLLAFYIGNNIEFEVSPSQFNLGIQHKGVKIEKDFRIEGFSVKGKVLTHENGEGISGAQILVTDENGVGSRKVITSGASGIFYLENMKTGTYSLKVTADHMQFESKAVKISPALPQVPDIFPSSFEICGKYKFQSKPHEIKIDFLKSSGEEYVPSKTVASIDGGSFCTFLPKGKYRIRPSPAIGTVTELVFSPKFIDIHVSHKPIFNIEFNEFAASIRGTVLLKSPKANIQDVSVVLINQENSKQVSATKPHSQTLDFHFQRVFPGKYILKIIKANAIWCWKEESIELTTQDKDITGITFQQEGFLVTLKSSHPTQLKISHPKYKKTVEIMESNHKITLCVPESGPYKINPLSCHLFVDEDGKEHPFTFDPDTEKNYVTINAYKHQLTGTVQTNVAANTSNDFRLVFTILSKDGIGSSQDLNLKLVSSSTDAEGSILSNYEFSIFVSPGENILFEPHSAHLLLKPRHYELTMPDDCSMNQIHFKAQTGVIIKGKVTPPLEGVVIRLFKRETQELLYETLTDRNGEYTGKPFDCCEILPASEEILVKAEKEGYLIKEASEYGNFISEKLSALKVIVCNVDEKGETPLQGALISISGGVDNFRKNLITPENGELTFLGLNPGEYFMRAVLKEYKFEPSSLIVNVKQGETVQIKVKGNRIAFSCFGSIISLSNEAEPNIMVEARSLSNTNDSSDAECSQFQEEVLSDNSGNFRIRDLKPGCKYIVALKGGSDAELQPKSIPPSQEIKILHQDVHEIKFILIPSSNTMEVTGDVLTSPEHWPLLRVKLFSSHDNELLASLPLSSAFFSVPFTLPIDGKTYTLKLESSLPTYSYSYDLPSISFKANVTYGHFQLKFSPRKLSQQDSIAGEFDNIGVGSMLTLPLIIIIGLMIYNHDKLVPFFSSSIERVQSILENVQGSSLNSDALNSRRKIKARKT